MRMTAASVYRDSIAAMERTSQTLLDFQEQVQTGKRINRPSDDPDGLASVIGEKAEVAAIEQYTRTGDSVTSRLTVLDTALTDIIDRLTLAQTTIVAAQGTQKTQGEREAAARTLDGIKAALLADLNTSYRGAHVFAGADSIDPPFTMTGSVISAYQGSSQEVEVDLDQTHVATIGIDGSQISRGSAAADIFGVLDNAMAAALAGDSAALGQALKDVEDAFDRATLVQTRVGTTLASMDSLQGALSDRRLAARSRISKIENVDLASAITGMTQADAAYRASLSATSRLTQLSLMDYLK